MNNTSNNPEKLAQELKNWQVEFPTSKQDSWKSIQAKIDSKTKETPIIPIKRNTGWKRVAIAASICLALGLTYFLNLDNVESFQTASADRMEITLPDNSKVILNAGSQLSFNESTWEDNRAVNLDGEAYFEVEPGSKFEVIASNGSVQVLGTGFNVFNRESQFKVGCAHGKVLVSANGEQVILTKGLYSELINKNLIDPIGNDFIKSWTNGEFHFEETKLIDVFAEVERQFGVEIEHDINSDRTFTGSFNSVSIVEAITVICEPMNLSFEQVSKGGKKILINNKTN